MNLPRSLASTTSARIELSARGTPFPGRGMGPHLSRLRGLGDDDGSTALSATDASNYFRSTAERKA